MKHESVIINGGNPLRGRIAIQGSKNCALPTLASSLLFKGRVSLRNVPDLADIRAMLDIISFLGGDVEFNNGEVQMNLSGLENKRIPDSLTNRLRASSLLLGPLLARFGECEIGMPGGCQIGVRPLDIHFKGFERLGATVVLENGLISIKGNKLSGDYTLDFPSVGATENLVACSIFNKNQVILRNIAKEPEVLDVIRFLVEGGAKIAFGEDHSSLIIDGISSLHDVEFTIQPDRIEAGTFLFAAAATKGNIQLTGVVPYHLAYPLQKLSDMGLAVQHDKDTISVAYKKPLKGSSFRTAVYPGFPTDLQSQLCVLLTQAETASTITETVFEQRFLYIDELLRMNAKISISDRTAYIEPSRLSGCRIQGYDLRGTASMVMAGLIADGVTHVSGLKHMYRGYEAFIEKLQHLGADICYV